MSCIIFESPLGRLFLEEEAESISRVQLLAPGEMAGGASREVPIPEGAAAVFCESGAGGLTSRFHGSAAPTPLLTEACRQLEAYFAGRLHRFDLPLAPKGTEFQRRVWEALCRIDYGTVKTYGDVAREIGSPRGFRAVGMACNRNPLLIVVPCHRVVGAGGRLIGFACGVDVKYRLLALEKSVLG